MDPSQQTLSAIDELRQIRREVRLTESMDSVRKAFERLQTIRRQHIEEFDVQIMVADAQQEIIDRARVLREGGTKSAAALISGPYKPEDAAASFPAKMESTSLMRAKNAGAKRSNAGPVEENSDAAEIPSEVPTIDKKSWQVAMGLAAFFTVAICALFFYLIQTARKINFEPDKGAAVTGPQKPASDAKTETVAAALPVVSMTPTLRLYTDLIPGTVTFDDRPEQTLVDGEFNLEKIAAGEHTVKVAGRSGSAAFTFSVADDKHAPRVASLPVSNNAMVVLVSVENGHGRLVTDESGAEISMDSTKTEGGEAVTMSRVVGSTPTVGFDGIELPDLGNIDHDLEITQARDKQKFVLTYTPAPALTVFVKSDPSEGMLTVLTGQDGVGVYIDDVLYRRSTDHGRLRVPLKVGSYRIRIHKDGFIDPPVARVDVKKAEEASVQFRMQLAPDFASLQIKGAQLGTTVYIDGQMVANIGEEGSARVVNIKSGDHMIELHHDQQVTKQLMRTFTTGATLMLGGADVTLDKLAADNKSVIPANPGSPVLPPPAIPQLQQPLEISSDAEIVHRGGGFVPYHTPRTSGHYYFQAHTRLGGLLKHGKLQWYAGYRDKDNYVLFTLDGKHADVREVIEGKGIDLGKVPFDVNTDEWVQVDVTLTPASIQARVKTNQKTWSDLSPVESTGHDFTKDGVGLYVPSNDEVAVANFRFSGR